MQEEKKEQSSEEFGLQKKDSKDQESMADKLNMNTFKQSCLIILIASIVAFIHNTERTQPFKPYINTTSNGQISPLVYAGEVHYSRIPV